MSISELEALIAKLVVHYKLVTPENLAHAQEVRAQHPRALGAVLLELGMIDQAQLDWIGSIEKEYRLRQASSEAKPVLSSEAKPVLGTAEKPLKLEEIFAQAVAQNASDVHIHAGAPIKLRTQGQLTDWGKTPLSPKEAQELVFSALTAEQRQLFEERGELDFAYMPQADKSKSLGRYRCNVYRSFRGYDGVFRLVPAKPPSLESLKLPATLKKLTDYHQGLVLVTGPSGCGKSTTMAALINIINRERSEHILTIEDPIECLHPPQAAHVNQRQIHAHTVTFARALRAALREDPDVIAIGELRDLETIQLALSAAETGHLVFGTLHTNSAVRTIDRITGVFPPSQQAQVRTMLSESLRAIISQRLLRAADGRSRYPALEILMVNKAVSNLIRENRSYQIRDVLQIGQAHGMCLLDSSIAELVRGGQVSREEALRHVEDPKRLGS